MNLPFKTVLFGSIGGLLLLGLLALVVSAVLLSDKYPSEQTVESSFTVDVDFTTVRKILVRTDAAKRIITMTGESEFIDQNWTAVGGGLDLVNLLNPKWNLELHGTLRVRTLDEYVGRSEITLRQDVNINGDQVHSDAELIEGSQRLLDYAMTTWFLRDEATGKTRVLLRLKQKILTDTPWFAHWIADRRVRASAQRAITNQQRAIRDVIAQNLDQSWLRSR